MSDRIPKSETPLTKKDFLSDQMVKWCPGCGDHAILSAVAQTFPRTGYQQDHFMVVSGIGCSSRFPYYVNTYGFHSIHGRAAAIATGIKITNPALSVWVATGDGDCTSIGGNHFIHIIRRNVDVTMILFNNQIYGLTKGQYSPTTPQGTITKTSPYGSIERPFNPGELVIGAEGNFFARCVDTNPKLLSDILLEASQHQGTSVVEVLQNCVIFADKAHAAITSPETRDDNQLILESGKPMLFGKNKEKGLCFDGHKLKVVHIGEDGVTLDQILVHDPTTKDSHLHMMLARMKLPEYPVALGVIRSTPCTTYEDVLEQQIADQKTASKIHCVDDLLCSGDTFDIK